MTFFLGVAAIIAPSGLQVSFIRSQGDCSQERLFPRFFDRQKGDRESAGVATIIKEKASIRCEPSCVFSRGIHPSSNLFRRQSSGVLV